METDPQSASIFTQLLILLVLTLMRGYFAGAEMAVASVNKNKIHRLKEQGNTKAALIERLMEGSTAFLSDSHTGRFSFQCGSSNRDFRNISCKDEPMGHTWQQDRCTGTCYHYPCLCKSGIRRTDP